MTASVASFLTQAQKKGAELPPALSGALLLAAVRLSDAQHQAVRPYQLLVDDDGALELLAGDAPASDAYAAPELRNGAVLADDARVLVFAAGALGYELITLTPPKIGDEGAGPEVKGPLASIIRKAMAERQHRFRTLREMARAIEAIAGRPSREEERLILAAVAASTPLPPSQKLAKLELEKASSPESAPQEPAEEQPKTAPVFTPIWDPLEAQAAAGAREAPARKDPGEGGDSGAPDAAAASAEAERNERAVMAAAIESRRRELGELGARVSILEEQVRSSLPPPVSGAAALAREAKLFLERRGFVEAERVLQGPAVANDAGLQLLLGQALSGGSAANGERLDRSAAAFRRAAELDPSWAQPRALLGAVLWRQGKRALARAEFRAALKLDPACPEALAANATARPTSAVVAISSAGAAVAAAALFIALRPAGGMVAIAPPRPVAAALAHEADPPPAQRSAPPATPVAVATATAPPPRVPARPAVAAAESKPPAPVSEPPPLRLPPERPREPAPPPVKVARAEAKPHRKSGNRTGAEAEAAKGEKALRAFDTNAAQAAFASALQLDPSLPSAHRGMGMVYVLLGKNSEAKAEYARYLELAPDAPDKEQINRVLSR